MSNGKWFGLVSGWHLGVGLAGCVYASMILRTWSWSPVVMAGPSLACVVEIAVWLTSGRYKRARVHLGSVGLAVLSPIWVSVFLLLAIGHRAAGLPGLIGAGIVAPTAVAVGAGLSRKWISPDTWLTQFDREQGVLHPGVPQGRAVPPAAIPTWFLFGFLLSLVAGLYVNLWPAMRRRPGGWRRFVDTSWPFSTFALCLLGAVSVALVLVIGGLFGACVVAQLKMIRGWERETGRTARYRDAADSNIRTF